MNRKKTKLFKINFSTAGMISILIFIASLLLTAAALVIAFRTYGHGDMIIAALGFLALFLEILGIIIPVRDRKKRPKEEGLALLSKIAIILNSLGIAGLAAIYIIGIVV